MIKVNKVSVVVAALFSVVALCANAYTYFYWRGPTDNPIWDTSTANWSVSDSGSASTTYHNNNGDTIVKFDGKGAADVTVDAGGVSALVVEGRGSHAFYGGPISATYLDPYSGNLTIYNTVNSGSLRLMTGQITVGDGGTLTVNDYHPWTSTADALDSAKVTVLAGGTLVVSNFANTVRSNYSTLYVNGGTIKYPQTNWRNHSEFSTSKIKMGPGGMHFAESWNLQQMFLPYPIENDGGESEGLWLDDHSSELVLYGSNTYKGGVHIQQGGSIRVQADSNLGYLPETPTNWIFFVGDGTKRASSVLQSHNNSNLVTLNKNRNVLIGDYVKARISTFNASQKFVIHGTFDCENRQNGVLQTGGYNNGGTIVLEPPANGTNHIGRLFVGQPTIIGSGTTMLENTTRLTYGGSSMQNEEPWGVLDGSSLNIADKGHLMVTGGVLKARGRMPCNSAKLTVSGGTVDLGSCELMHGYWAPATTTIRDGGRLIVSSIRMAGDNGSYYGNANNSIVNVETGGVLRVLSTIYIGHDGRKGTLNFNGGALEWANTERIARMEGGTYLSRTCDGLTLNVLEGGMIVTNTHATTLMVRVPVRSGAAQDGGVTVWGAGSTFSLEGACTFNGPLTIMQGSYRLGGNELLNSNITVRVNSGAGFSMNTFSQSLARLEGSGHFGGTSATAVLTVTEAIAPGMSTNSLGTLSFPDYGATIADDVALEIDVDENGNSDCMTYPALIDLSKMTLKINDLTKLNSKKRYKIATLAGGIKGGQLFKSTNLPEGWMVRYSETSHELIVAPEIGVSIILR